MKSALKVAARLSTAAVLTTALTACGSDDGGAAGGADDGFTIGFVNADNLDFHQCLRAGVDAEAEKRGVEIVEANSIRDPGKEQSNVEDMIVRQVDAIVLQTVNIDSLEGAIANANAADIPIFLTSVGGPDLDSVAGAELSDVRQTGERSAAWLAEDAAGQDVKVGIIAGAPGAASDLFIAGFKSKLPTTASVVFEQPGMFQRAKAQEVTENMLQSNSDVDYVFVPNEEMAFGALTAFENAERSDIKIIANGGTEKGLEATADGRFAMLVASSPYDLGAKAIATVTDLLENPEDEPVIGEVPLTVVTKENVADAPPYCG